MSLLTPSSLIVIGSLAALALIDSSTDFLPESTVVWYFLTFAISYFVATSSYVQGRSVTKESMNGKVVLLTGASSGIGEHMAYVYAKLGARLLICARRLERLEAVRDACLSKGSPQVGIFQADFNKNDTPKKVVDFCLEKYDGVLDTMILNHADMRQEKLLIDHSEEELQIFQETTNTNYISNVKMCYYALPALRKSGGSIGLSSSGSALAATPFHTAYCSSKSALNEFGISLRRELELMQPPPPSDVKPVSVTVCIIGNIATSQKGKKFRESAYSEERAAEDMVQAIGSRLDLAYVPWFVRFGQVLNPFPRINEQILYHAYTKNRPEFMDALAYHRKHGAEHDAYGSKGKNYKYANRE